MPKGVRHHLSSNGLSNFALDHIPRLRVVIEELDAYWPARRERLKGDLEVMWTVVPLELNNPASAAIKVLRFMSPSNMSGSLPFANHDPVSMPVCTGQAFHATLLP